MRHASLYTRSCRRLAVVLVLTMLAPRMLEAQGPQWRRMGIDTLQVSGEAYSGIVRSVNVDSTGSIYVTTPSDTIHDAGRVKSLNTLWRSDDDGATWKRLRDDVFGDWIVTPFAGMIHAYAIKRHPIYITVMPLEISTDRGATWTVVMPDAYPTEPAWNAAGVVVLGAIENRETKRAILVSADSGRTWTRTDRANKYFPLHFAVTSSGTVVVNGWAGVNKGAHERSTDFGRTWVGVDSVPLNSVVAAMPHGTLFAHGLGIPGSGQQPKHIYRSTDDGLTWQMSLDSVGNIYSFHQAGERAVLAYGYRSLMRTTDDGLTWSRPTESDSTLADLFDFLQDRTGAVVALDTHARSGSGVLRSSDAGATWSRVGAGITIDAGGRYYGHAITPSGVHLVATSNGLWRNDGVSSVDDETAALTPVTMSVSPNPVRSASTITLRLPRPASVTLTLHDALGRALRTIHDGRLAAGERAVRLDAQGLEPGAYLLRATIDGAVTGRTIIVR